MKPPKTLKKYLLNGQLASMVCEVVKGEEVSNAEMAYNILKPLMAQARDVEQFWMIALDAKNRIVALEKLFTGSLSCCTVYPREIIKKLFAHEAAAAIFAHNHPSGDIAPSPEDSSITKRLVFALGLCGITVHDHNIIGANGSYFSYADNGYIANYNRQLKSFEEC